MGWDGRAKLGWVGGGRGGNVGRRNLDSTHSSSLRLVFRLLKGQR